MLPLAPYAIAVTATGVLLLIHTAVLPYLQGQVIYSVFLLPVLWLTWFRMLGPALFAVGLAGMASLYLSWEQAEHSYTNLITQLNVAACVLIGFGTVLLQRYHHSSPTDQQGEGNEQPSGGERIEKALRESEEQLRATFHQSAFGMAQADLDGRHLLVNQRYCQLTGYSREELLGCTFLDITHPDDVDSNRQRFDQLLAGETRSYEIEKRYIRKDGSLLWVQVSVAFALDPFGAPRYAIAGVQDISERKRKEQTLRFLVDLNTATQQLIEPSEIMQVVARMLGDHLAADRCAYAEVESDENHFTITGDHTRGVSSIVGRFSMADFGSEALRLMRAGQAYIVADVDLDPRITAKNLPAYRATQIMAVVCVPLQKAGKFEACMAVHQRVPRHWSTEEIELIQLVVGRCWESLERARIVRNLREGEQRLGFILDSMPQKIFTTSPEGVLDYLNPQWISFAGLSFDEFKQWGSEQLVHSDDLERTQHSWSQSLETGVPLQVEHRFRRSDNEYRWHVTRVLPVRDAKGQISMWIGSNTDIHEVKRAEEAAIHRSEQVRSLAVLASRLNTNADIAALLEVVTREARALISCNQSITSFSADQDWKHALNSTSLSQKYIAWRHNQQADASELFAQICQDNKPIRIARGDLGSYPSLMAIYHAFEGCLIAPLIERDGTTVGFIQLFDKIEGDFTPDDEAVLAQLAQMTSVAVENVQLVEGLKQADRRKDEFLATLAHELRNPLAPMRNMLEIMKRSESGNPVIDQARVMIERQLVHMVRLIDDLLDVSRVNRGKLELRLEQVELALVVEQTVEAFQSAIAAAGHELRVILPSEPVYLKADSARLTQIFGNLLDNACKYTEPGGQIIFTAELQGEELVISVKDSGIGIPIDKLDNIFEMFAQVDSSLERMRAGLGIGLTLVKRLVEMHQGIISAHSAGPNLGSEFVLCLPVLNPSQRTILPPPTVIHSSPAAPRRILVVDDNLDAALSLAAVLQLNGDETLTAHDGLEALAVAERFHPDVILLDIGMPKLNGYEVCRHIRAQRKDVMIIAVSGWGQAQDRLQSEQAGFNYHMVKPLDLSALLSLLAETQCWPSQIENEP